MPPKVTFPSCSSSRALPSRERPSAIVSGGNRGRPPRTSGSGVSAPHRARSTNVAGAVVSASPPYGDIVESDEVHHEIRELGSQVRDVIAQHLPRHGTTQEQVMWGVRQFGPSKESRRVLNRENDAAGLACETGVYCVWRCCEKPRLSGGNQDFCCRLGYQHLCFCGHTLAAHTTPGRAANSSAAHARAGGEKNEVEGGCDGRTSSRAASASPATDAQLAQWKGPCETAGCACARYRYVPNTPLEIGEAWLTRRANWKASEWSAKCRCGHGHKAHDARTMRCGSCGGCSGFTSAFLCVVCDLPWEAHDTVWESEGVRRREGRPVCAEYAPLAGIDWDVREAVLNDASMGGRLEPPATYLALQQRQGGRTSGSRGSLKDSSPFAVHAFKGRGSIPSTGALPALTAKPPSATVAVAADPSLNVEYCHHCATIYKRAESKFCAQCGQPRPLRPTKLP